MDDDEQHVGPEHPRVPKVSPLLVVALVLLAAGAGLIGIGVHAQRHAPQPPAWAAIPIAALPVELGFGSTPADIAAPIPGTSPPQVRGPLLPAAAATRLSIPSIGVNTSLLRLGLNADHTVQVPPQTRKAQAGWYRKSPAPGQRVERVVSYTKNNFPTLDVYGNTDHAALRLITCGGMFDVTRHSYESNIVA